MFPDYMDIRVTIPSKERKRELVDPFVQPKPQAISKLDRPSRILNANSTRKPASVVASHTDVVFVVSSIMTFLGPTMEMLDIVRDDSQHLTPVNSAKITRAVRRTKEHRELLKDDIASMIAVEKDRTPPSTPTFSPTPIPTGTPTKKSNLDISAEPNSVEIIPFTYQVKVQISGMKLLLIDPTLGLHLPLVKLSIGDLNCLLGSIIESDQYENQECKQQSEIPRLMLEETNPTLACLAASPRRDPLPMNVFNVSIKFRLWGDYFNNTIKCWEPLLEPFACRILLEHGGIRGMGLTVKATSPLLINVSSAFLQTISYLIRLISKFPADLLEVEKRFQGLFCSTYDADVASILGTFSLSEKLLESKEKEETEDVVVESRMVPVDGLVGGSSNFLSSPRTPTTVKLAHKFPRPLGNDGRTPFSICNFTGQRIRYYHPQTRESCTTLHYLRHHETGVLAFGATMSVLRNMKPVEVDFDISRDLMGPDEEFGPLSLEDVNGRYEEEKKMDEEIKGYSEWLGPSKGWSVSVQVSGYRWLTNLSADSLGMQFEALTPLLGQLNAPRIIGDWKISNALKLVNEVRLQNGCRQLTLRSCFRIKNCTKHDLILISHPSAKYRPTVKDFEDTSSIPLSGEGGAPSPADPPPTTRGFFESADGPVRYKVLPPGGVYHVPLLLLWSALTIDGDPEPNLGKIWVRPRHWSVPKSQQRTRKEEVQFSQEPLDLLFIVLDTLARMYEHAASSSAAPVSSLETGYPAPLKGSYLVCPITRGNSANTTSIPPVSFSVEVLRSAVKQTKEDNEDGPGELETRESLKKLKTKTNTAKKKDGFKHDPVDYTLMIHPPLVLENLLPERCVFALHDLKTRTLLWEKEFEAGQSKSVHDVR